MLKVKFETGHSGKLWRLDALRLAGTLPTHFISIRGDPFLERGVLPRVRTFRHPVLHRVVMDVIHVLVEIFLIFDCVLPILSLPDASPTC